MESVGLAIEVNIICIVVLFLVRQSNREAASLLLCARALNRLLDFFIAFAALEIVGKLLAPEAVVACRIIECLKVIACLAIAAAWFYMVCYAVTSSSYKLQKWAILIRGAESHPVDPPERGLLRLPDRRKRRKHPQFA